MARALYIAIDLGAGSGRVMLGGVAPGELLLEEVRRFHYPIERRDGHLRWDLARIWREIEAGLVEAAAIARAADRPIRSVGACTWGVDYGLFDDAGALLEDPVCYRDPRTKDSMAKLFDRVPREEVFARTGIQFLPLNTIFQLLAHAEMGLPADAAQLLMIPDILHYRLSGRLATEYTNATTTQLVNARTRTWDPDLVRAAGVPPTLLAPLVPAGTDLGPVLPGVAECLGLPGVRVVAPATHDTASAVAGAPLRDGWGFISSGTWSLVGVEQPEPRIDGAVLRHNFTNEGGAAGTVRFLKNVMGMWLLESCRKEWQSQGRECSHAELLRQIVDREDVAGLIFPDDPRLFNPPSMARAVNAQLAETGQPTSEDPVTLTKVILDSLALRYARVVDIIEALTGRRPAGLQIVGGGSQNGYLNQATATATGLPVLAGPVEATAAGNVLVQAMACGLFSSLAEARAHLRANIREDAFSPRRTAAWQAAARRYAEIEDRFAARGA